MATAPDHDKEIEANVKDFQTFVSFILTISIFGVSTFAVIVGQMQDPADIWKPDPPPFTLSRVRTFLAIAWLCFVLSLAVAGYSSSLITIWRQRALGAIAAGSDRSEWWKNWDRFGVAVSVILHILVVLAFFFLSISLVAYVGAAGWVMVGFTSAALVFVLALSSYQILNKGD